MYKVKFKTKDEAPKELHEFLKETAEKDGFEANLAPASKVDEFRQNNIRVSQENDTLKKALQPFTEIAGKTDDGKERPLTDLLKDIETWKKTAQQVKDGTLKGSDVIDKEVEARTGAMKSAYEEQIGKLGQEAGQWKSKYEAAVVANNMKTIDSAIAQAAALPAVGLNMDALPDVLRRARDEWTVEADGKLVAKKGEMVLRGEDGVSPLTVEEWFKGLRKTAGYYFKGSQGGGAGGGDGGSTDVEGLTTADLAKMTPMERLRYANANPPKRNKR